MSQNAPFHLLLFASKGQRLRLLKLRRPRGYVVQSGNEVRDEVMEAICWSTINRQYWNKQIEITYSKGQISSVESNVTAPSRKG